MPNLECGNEICFLFQRPEKKYGYGPDISMNFAPDGSLESGK